METIYNALYCSLEKRIILEDKDRRGYTEWHLNNHVAEGMSLKDKLINCLHDFELVATGNYFYSSSCGMMFRCKKCKEAFYYNNK